MPLPLLAIWLSVIASAKAEQITTTIHSTHSSVKLCPEFSCKGTIFHGCGPKYDSWALTTYQGHDGRRRTFHQVNSAGNDLRNWDFTRHISIPFQGTSLYMYMAPRHLLHHPPGRQEICMYGTCQSIDVEGRYREVGYSDEPVLMWWAENLDQNRFTFIELRLLDNGGRGGRRSMSLSHFTYSMDITPEDIPALEEGTYLSNVTLHDTNYAVDYSPLRSHSRCCGDYNPWDRQYFSSVFAESTFHHTSNWGSDPVGPGIRQVSFRFKGGSIYLYGPPPRALLEKFGSGLVHGHQEVCVDNQCGGLDVHQAYLNVAPADEDKPVLIWSFDFVSPDLRPLLPVRSPSAVQALSAPSLGSEMTLRLRLLDPDSPVRGSHMIFDHVVVSEIRLTSSPRWAHPLPEGSYTKHTVYAEQCSEIFELCKAPWSPFGSLPVGARAWDAVHQESMPSWKYNFRGHSVKVYGVSAASMGSERRHATQRICIDYSDCQYVDVEQIYLSVSPWMRYAPVLLFEAADLDPFERHIISVVAARKPYDQDPPRVMTFAYLEYEQFNDYTSWIDLEELVIACAAFLIPCPIVLLLARAFMKLFSAGSASESGPLLDEPRYPGYSAVDPSPPPYNRTAPPCQKPLKGKTKMTTS